MCKRMGLRMIPRREGVRLPSPMIDIEVAAVGIAQVVWGGR